MKFVLYNDWSDLGKNSETLFTEAQKVSVFLSKEWFESLTPYLVNQEQQLLLACVVDGNSVAAVLPLLTHENREWSSFTHPYSGLFTLLLAPENKTQIVACLCHGLKWLAFDYLTLAPIDAKDDHWMLFQHTLEKNKISYYQNHKAYNWFHPINDKQNYADYLAQRHSKVRNTVLRKQRKLKREHAYEIQLHVTGNIKQALADYHDIYKVSWKANEQYESLVKDALQRFSKRSWPRLAIMSIDGKPIAAQLWFVVDKKASIFRLVYDESWKSYSPGTILMAYLLEHVIDVDKVKEVDFLSGNDAYKKDWMSKRRERSSLVITKKMKIQNERNLFKQLIQRCFTFFHEIHGNKKHIKNSAFICFSMAFSVIRGK